MNSPKTSSQSIGSWLSPRKRAFITGTLLLTGTGFLCRVLGFFYRIRAVIGTGTPGQCGHYHRCRQKGCH